MGKVQNPVSLRSLPRIKLLKFVRDTHAATATEFALLAVPFFGLLCCALELGVVLLLGTAVENTTQQIARLIKTGQLQQKSIQSLSDFRTRLLCPSTGAALLPAYLDCSRFTIDVRTTTALNGANLSNGIYKDTSGAKFCLGSAQSIVVVRVAYAVPAILTVLALLPDGSLSQNQAGLVNDVPNHPGWNHMLFKAAAFQNEKYSSSSSACS